MAEPEPNDLAAELRALRAQVAGLQADVRRLEAGGFANADHGWAVEGEAAEPSLSWISTLEAPLPRRLAVPRLVLEIAFLALVAVLAVLAELEPVAIVAVMGAAWLLVAFAEWASSSADRRREELLLASPFAPTAPPVSDPAWFAPPVEHTILQTPEADPGADTGAATLPPLAESEQTAERRPA
jgi:hypothetical protein